MSEGRIPRQKSHFWGYDQHERDIRDVVDEERWRKEERWAVEESLHYATLVQRPSFPQLAGRSYMDAFEAMLNDLLHEPLNTCTASEAVQETEQATLGGEQR